MFPCGIKVTKELKLIKSNGNDEVAFSGLLLIRVLLENSEDEYETYRTSE
jgi:hypothetical protein